MASKYPSLERSPGKADNWVEQTGGLPAFIDKIARTLHHERGMTIGRAIATAVEACRKWAAGGGDVNPDTRAKAQAALAAWEAKKAASRARTAAKRTVSLATDADGHVWVDLAALDDDEWDLIDLAPGDGKPPYHWKHGYVPITPAAALSKAKGNKTRAAKLLQKGDTTPGGSSSDSSTTPMRPAASKAADDAARGRSSTPGKVDKPDTARQGGAVTTATAKLPVGTPVKARNPGGMEADGKIVGYDDNGWPRVQHTLSTGRTVVGTFDPAGTKRKSDGQQAAPATGDATAPRPRAQVAESARQAADPQLLKRSTSTNPDADVRVEHGPDGTLVRGTSRDDRETVDALKGAGFKWSRNLDAWYLPRTWGEATRDQRVKGLEAKLGDKIGVDREAGPRRSAAERDAETRERAAARADRLEGKSGKLAEESERRRAASDRLSDAIPFGQPILVGHHSEGRHRRDLDRIRRDTEKSWEADKASKDAAAGAERARRTAAGDESKTTIANRIERNEAQLRSLERQNRGTSDAAAELRDAISYDKGKLEKAGGLTASKDTVSPGDFVKIGGAWYPVLKSNAKTASVPSPMGLRSGQTAPWQKVTEVRKAGDVTREDVARMVQETSAAFPSLRAELAKRAPAKKETADAPQTEAQAAGRSAGGSSAGQVTRPAGAGAGDGGSGAGSGRFAPKSVAAPNARQAAFDRAKSAENRGEHLEAARAYAELGDLEAVSKVRVKAIAAGKDVSGFPKGAPGKDESGGITAATARRMSDEQLERATSRLAAEGGWGSPAMAVLEAELERRDEADRKRKAGGSAPKGRTR